MSKRTLVLIVSSLLLFLMLAGVLIKEARPIHREEIRRNYIFEDKQRVFKQYLSPSKNHDQLFDILMDEVDAPTLFNQNLSQIDNKDGGFLVKGKSDYIETLFDGKQSAYRLSYTDEVQNNPIPFLTLMSSMIVHGKKDRQKTFDEKLEALNGRHLLLVCGEVSVFAKQILNEIGVLARIVTTLTLEDWTSYDNGHTLLEVYVRDLKRWVLIDLDQKIVFRNSKTGKLINALELSQMSFDDVELVKLIDTDINDFGSYKENQILLDYLRINKRDWFRRSLQIIAIYDDSIDKYVFVDNTENPEIKNRVESYSKAYTVTDKKDFAERFYGETP